jgi:hypothetical protein
MPLSSKLGVLVLSFVLSLLPKQQKALSRVLAIGTACRYVAVTAMLISDN